MTENRHDLEYYMSLSYRYELHRDEEDGSYFATHPELSGCAAQADTADEAVANLDAARRMWIATRLKDDLPIPEPLPDELSGRILLRMPTGLHGELAKQAASQGVSLNSWLVRLLSEHAAGFEVKWKIENLIQEMKSEVLRLVADQIRGSAHRFEQEVGPLDLNRKITISNVTIGESIREYSRNTTTDVLEPTSVGFVAAAARRKRPLLLNVEEYEA